MSRSSQSQCHHRIVRLLLSFTLLFRTFTAGSFLEDDFNDLSKRRRRASVLDDTSRVLASAGITGLCHPLTDEYSPWFPQCPDTTGMTNEEDSLIEQQQQRRRRRLEQENDDQVNDNDDDYNLQYDEYLKEYQYGEYNYDTSEWYKYNTNSNKDIPRTTWFYVFNAALTVICIFAGSLSSGLYIGLLSLDPLLLVIKSRTSKSEKEKFQIRQVLGLIKRRHQLIVTLLIISSLAAEAMPVFLQRLVHDYVAILVSVILVLFFGEILPAMLFTGVNQIEMAGRLAPVVRLWMCLLYPVTYPIAHILELLSSGGDGMGCCAGDSLSSTDGDHHGVGMGGTLYNRGELAALIRVQYEHRRALRKRRKDMQKQSSMSSLNQIDVSEMSIPEFTTPTSSMDMRNLKRGFHKQASMASIDSHDVKMMEGALNLKTKSAIDVFLSFHKAFCIPFDMVLDETNIFTIYASGYSRVPVYVNGDRRQIRGILLTRHLMVVNNKKDGGKPPTPMDLSLHTPRCVPPDENLTQLMNLFQTGNSAVQAGHMALVCARPDVGNQALKRGEAIPEQAGLMGICTLEDVLEALLQEQIYDEVDTSAEIVRRIPDGMATIQESGTYMSMT